MFAQQLYPHVFQKAAAMLRSVAQNQAFLDGNKRIAWIATITFLAANGVDVIASADDGLGMMIAVAKSEIDLDGIGAFLAERASLRDDLEDDEAS